MLEQKPCLARGVCRKDLLVSVSWDTYYSDDKIDLVLATLSLAVEKLTVRGSSKYTQTL